jgi:hypothetical protein
MPNWLVTKSLGVNRAPARSKGTDVRLKGFRSCREDIDVRFEKSSIAWAGHLRLGKNSVRIGLAKRPGFRSFSSGISVMTSTYPFLPGKHSWAVAARSVARSRHDDER